MRTPFPSKKRLIVLLACACMSGWAAAGGGSTLEERMSYKEFREFGLDHLSAEQLRGLNAWLQAHGLDRTGAAATLTPGAAVPAPQAVAPADERIESRIAGPFNGWHQGTILALENGQRWEVRDDETVYAHDEAHPRVTIEKGGLIGGWRLSIDGRSEFAHVVPVTNQ